MGSDLIIMALPIRTGRNPDWDAGFVWVETATDEELDAGTEGAQFFGALDEGDAAEVREYLKGRVTEARDAVEQGFRDTSWIEWDGWTFWVTGGMSAGDNPTDTFQAFMDISEVPPLARAIGFFEKEPAGVRV